MSHVLGWELASYGFAAAVLSVICASVALVKLNLYREVLLSAASLLLSSFLVFGFVELFPDLARSLHLSSIHYYALRERYITDETLIFRMRPFYQFSMTGYKGDLYKPIYGIDGGEVRFAGAGNKDGFSNVGGGRDSEIVVIGDSFIEASETNTDLFTERLARISGRRVMNLGTAWYGPFQYLEMLKRYGLESKPKYAVLSFFEGNDLNDVREYIHWKKGGDYYHFNLSSKGVLARYRLALRETVDYLKLMVKAFKENETVKENRGRTVHPDLVDLQLGDKHLSARFGYMIDTRDSSQLAQTDEWKELITLLMEFRNICAEHHIVPLLMFIPTKAHIYAEYTTELSGASWKNIRAGQIAARDNMRNAIIGLADDLHIQLIDLAPTFENAAREGKLLYYPFDTHWNSVGRETAAEALAKSLGTPWPN